MKRHFVVVSLLFAITFSAISCQKKETSGGGKEVLTMYNYRDKTAANAAEFDIILEQFYEANPNVQFEVEELFNEPFHQKLQAMAVSGGLPDIVRLWPGKRTGYVTGQGLVKDLRPYLGDEKNNFMAIAMAPQGPNGEIYELPWKITVTNVVYTNEKLLRELGLSYPQTMAELYEQSPVIREAGYVPVAMTNKDGWQMQSTFLSALVERTGGQKWFAGAVSGQNSFS
ncbi:MAG: extracellular solute-binding protein, partial [Spirochaetota bacterium]